MHVTKVVDGAVYLNFFLTIDPAEHYLEVLRILTGQVDYAGFHLLGTATQFLFEELGLVVKDRAMHSPVAITGTDGDFA